MEVGADMKIKTLLVDSNHSLRDQLKVLLQIFRVFQLEAELDRTEDALEYASIYEVDVIFINMQPADPQTTSQGSYLAAVLAQIHPHIQVVVYSDDPANAFDAFRYQCTGFLLTPFDALVVQGLVNKLTYIYDLQLTKRECLNRSIMIRTRNGYQLARVADILFVERSNRKNRIVCSDGREIPIVGYTMNELEAMLEGSGFYRCYQSFIVNLSQISFIRVDNDAKNYFIELRGYTGNILLSRDKYTEIVALLKDRYAKLNL